MKKLYLELRIVNDDSKQLLITKVPMEVLDTIVKKGGENAVKNSIWEMFNKLVTELEK